MADNPYAAPSASLFIPQNAAQAAKELRSARSILILVGVIEILFNAINLTLAKMEFDAQSERAVREMATGDGVSQVDLGAVRDEKRIRVYAGFGLSLVLGVIFLGMAGLVHRHPVRVTQAALVLFIAVHVGVAAIQSAAIYDVIGLKILFLLALWKAWQCARKATA